MLKANWNYVKWKLPSGCRETIARRYSITDCYYSSLSPTMSKKFDVFKLVTKSGKEIGIFCKYSSEYEMNMHRKICDLVHGTDCSAVVPRYFGFWKNRLFIEYLQDSVTLEQFFATEHTDEEIESILEQLGKFLAVLHSNRILHRDLNLGNIMYSQKDMKIHVIDFELSEDVKERTGADNSREIRSIVRQLSAYIKNKDLISTLEREYRSKLDAETDR